MKRVFIATALTIACAAAFSQKAPLVTQDGPGAAPVAGGAAASQEKLDSRNAATPNPTTKQPQLVGQDGPKSVPTDAAAKDKLDSRNTATPNPTTKQPVLVGQDGPGDAAYQARMDARNAKMYAAMDANGDGRVSRAEWNAHHGKTWDGMKHSNGAVSREEMEMMMKRTN
jgi:hypothetical protein